MANAPEEIARRLLARLERLQQQAALAGLADWGRTGIVATSLFSALTGLARPSWGTWNGLLEALRRGRRDVIRQGSGDERRRLEGARDLQKVLEHFERPIGNSGARLLAGTEDLLGGPLKARMRQREVFSRLIRLRNVIAHQQPADTTWWETAQRALEAVQSHFESSRFDPVGDLSSATTSSMPWFVRDDEDLWLFQGLTRGGEAVLVDSAGRRQTSRNEGAAVLRELQRLLGRTDVQERDLRRLFGRLAPEEVKGVLLGDYLVGRPVGEGGFGTVHIGRQLSTGRQVALKLLRDGMSAETKARFRQEAAYLSRIEHASVVQVIGYGEEPWSSPRSFSLDDEEWFQTFKTSAPVKSFIAMEWVEGQTLEQIYVTAPVRKPREVARWFEQAARALAVVHASGMIHRDVKPSNLMVDDRGQIRLMDFGIARSLDEERTLQTQTGTALGTPAYMSPEQLRARDAEAEVGPRSDVYSLCATFYEVFTRTRLYDHDTTASHTVETLKTEGHLPDAPRQRRRGIDWTLDTILMGGLEPEPGDRYATAEALANDVEHYLANEPIVYERPSLLQRARLAYRRRRVVWHLAGIFFLVAVTGLTAYVLQIRREQARTALERDLKEEQRKLAVANEKRAQLREAESRELLVEMKSAMSRMYTARQTLDIAGDLSGALLRSATALRFVESDLRDEAVLVSEAASLRRRIGILLRVMPELVVQAAGPVALRYPAASTGGRWFLSWHELGFQLWDGTTGRAVSPIWPNPGGLRQVSLQAYQPDAAGRRVMLCANDGFLPEDGPMGLIWAKDARTGEDLGPPVPTTSRWRMAGISPDGRWIFATDMDGRIHLLDLEEPDFAVRHLRHESERVYVAAFAPGGRRLVTASHSGTVRIWDLESGTPHSVLPLRLTFPQLLVFDPTGRRLATVSSGQLALWDAATGVGICEVPEQSDAVKSVRFSPDGRHFACTYANRSGVQIWRMDVPKAIPVGHLYHGRSLMGMDFDADGRHIVTWGEGAFRRWRWQAFTPPHLTTPGTGGRLTPDGRLVLSWENGSATAPGRMWVVDGETGAVIGEYEAPGGAVADVALAADGTLAATSHLGSRIEIRALPSGDLISTLEKSVPERGLAFDASARRVMAPMKSPSGFPAFGVWNAATGKLLLGPLEHQGLLTSSEFGPLNRRLLTCGADGSRLWDADTGAAVAFLQHQLPVLKAHFSPDGLRVLTGGWEGNAQLWDARTGSPLGSPFVHEGSVMDVAFTPDGERCLTVSGNGVIQGWSIALGRANARPMRHADPVLGLALAPAGRGLLSVTRAGEVRYWDWGNGELLSPPLPVLPVVNVMHAIERPHVEFLDEESARVVAGGRVIQIDLTPAEEEANRLLARAELLAARHIEEADALVHLSAEQLAERWAQVHGR